MDAMRPNLRQYIGGWALAVVVVCAIGLARCLLVFEDTLGDCAGFIPFFVLATTVSALLVAPIAALRKRDLGAKPGWWPGRRGDHREP